MYLIYITLVHVYKLVGILWSFWVIGHSQYQGWGPMYVDHRHTHSDYNSTKVLPGNVNKSTTMYSLYLSKNKSTCYGDV